MYEVPWVGASGKALSENCGLQFTTNVRFIHVNHLSSLQQFTLQWGKTAATLCTTSTTGKDTPTLCTVIVCRWLGGWPMSLFIEPFWWEYIRTLGANYSHRLNTFRVHFASVTHTLCTHILICTCAYTLSLCAHICTHKCPHTRTNSPLQTRSTLNAPPAFGAILPQGEPLTREDSVDGLNTLVGVAIPTALVPHYEAYVRSFTTYTARL